MSQCLGSLKGVWNLEMKTGKDVEDSLAGGKTSGKEECGSIYGTLSGVTLSCKLTPFGSYQLPAGLYTYSFYVSNRAIIDPWPTDQCGPWDLFYVSD